MTGKLMVPDALRNEYIDNRETVRKAFYWSGGYTFPVCSIILAGSSRGFDAEQLKGYRRMVKESTGVFSNFRSTVMEPMACMLAVSDDPKVLMTRTLDAYAALKAHFFSDEYIALTAMIIAQLAGTGDFAQLAMRTRNIYNRMKKKHPMVTSREDVPFAAMLAFSGMTDEQASSHAEECFSLLRGGFAMANAAQSLSHVLALGEGSASDKCAKLIDLYDELKLRGYRFGKSYEISTLAAVSLLPVSVSELAQEIVETADWLKGKKGYGILGAAKRERLMHATMIVSSAYSDKADSATAVGASLGSSIAATIALVAAQQAAVCAAIIAANAAASSASASS